MYLNILKLPGFDPKFVTSTAAAANACGFPSARTTPFAIPT
jgi:hypothetical protein